MHADKTIVEKYFKLILTGELSYDATCITYITGTFPWQHVNILENCLKLRSRVDIERIQFFFVKVNRVNRHSAAYAFVHFVIYI